MLNAAGRPDSADDDASTRAMVGRSDPSDSTPPLTTQIPIIKVSSESDRSPELEERQGAIGKEPDGATPVDGGAPKSAVETVKNEVERPRQAAANEEDNSDGYAAPAAQDFSFSNKRLCERWLDNLFMVLYEVRYIFSLAILQILICHLSVRTYVYGPSSAPKWLTLKPSMLFIAKPAPNGRFLEI